MPRPSRLLRFGLLLGGWFGFVAAVSCGGDDGGEVPEGAEAVPGVEAGQDPASSPPGEEGASSSSRETSAGDGEEEPTPEEIRERDRQRSLAIPPIEIPDDPPKFERPERVRGLYLNAWTAGSRRRVDQLVELARRTEINSFVIDIKDASGYVSHPTRVELAREIEAHAQIRIRDLEGLLRRLADEGIYPIARIVVVKDPILAAARPDLAIQDTVGGVFVDSKGLVWTNPYAKEVWDYHIELAREVARVGFPEIQWDYVRFPDISQSDWGRTVFPGADGRPRARAIRDFLAYSRDELEELGVEVTADVFGVTTSASTDVGIGQLWEEFIDVVDVALPMVYPSHYWEGSFGYREPNSFPYEIVKEALERGLERSEGIENAAAVRPWLQDFTLGEPPYGAAEVRAQIQAAYDVGIEEWILWNPGSRYTEAALAPEGGFPRGAEPPIRAGNRIVPVERRFEAVREWKAEQARLDSLRAAQEREAVDTTGAARDTTGVAMDTTGGGR